MDLNLPADHSRFEKFDKASHLSHCALFSGLTQWELKSISQMTRLVEFKKDEVIYKEGGEAGSFYIIVSGRFEASTTVYDKKKILAYLRRGDYFGEMSLLTNEPHSATIRALSDSLLLELKKDDFKKAVEHNAAISLELSRRLSSRLRGTSDERSRLLSKSDVISIYSSQRRSGRTEFAINLAASLIHETRQRTILLDMSPSGAEVASKLHIAKKVPLTHFHNIENEPPEILSNFVVKHPVGFEVLNVAHEEKDKVGENIIIPLLNHLAVDYRFIVIDLPSTVDEMALKAMSQSDSIYCVTDSHLNNITEAKDVVAGIEKELAFPEDRIAIVINEGFFGVRTTVSTKRELFGKKVAYSLPSTPELKEYEEQHLMPFVVDEPEAEYSRVVRHIARRISNNLVGIALGSGAALGLAHIGVLKVLEREGIPIDIVAGSSIGALVGSLYAVGKNVDELEKAAMEINSRLRLSQLADISLYPVRGLLNGKRIIRHFKKHLGNKTFEDCRIPLKIMGVNLSTRQRMVFESGLITEAVRASIAIPAIFKPVFIKGETIIDGGILSPLPVRALQQAGANKIIAVNVFPTVKDTLERKILLEEAAEKEAALMRQKNFIARSFFRLSKWIGRRFFPNVFDIIMNTIQTMETEISEVEGEAADVVLRPVIPEASWVDFYRPQQFIRRGEEEAMKLLPKIKALVSQQNV
ncbi:MAG: patatin-like phospholipase family protein [Candidatus Omnitrophota bacterium]